MTYGDLVEALYDAFLEWPFPVATAFVALVVDEVDDGCGWWRAA